MSRHATPAAAAGAAFVVALVACGSKADAGAASTDASGRAMPPIHADLITEELYRGENSQRRNYRDALVRCQDAGFPITPLSPSQLELLGTVRVQLWFAPGLQVMRQEIFEFALREPLGSCHFQLVRDGGQQYVDARVERWVDFKTGETSEGEPQFHTLNRVAIEPVTAQAAATSAGWPVPTASTIAGQACTLWEDPRFGGRRICLWAGGLEWGFRNDQPSSGCLPELLSIYESRIVLAEEPLSGNGCRITTRSFTVGKPFGPADYAPPPADGATR